MKKTKYTLCLVFILNIKQTSIKTAESSKHSTVKSIDFPIFSTH